MTETVFLALIFGIACLALFLIDRAGRRNVLRIKEPPEKDRAYHADQSLPPNEEKERFTWQ